MALPTIASLLGLADVPQNITQWHARIQAGVPVDALPLLAQALALPESELARSYLGLTAQMFARRQAAQVFNAQESDRLWRLARAYRALLVPRAAADARAWLLASAPELRGARPLELLGTTLGTEAVMAAIARMRPADKTRIWAEAPDFEEGLRREALAAQEPERDAPLEEGNLAQAREPFADDDEEEDGPRDLYTELMRSR